MMTKFETRGRLTKEEKSEPSNRVNKTQTGECGHVLNSKNVGSHFICTCCARGTNSVAMNGTNGHNVCMDCFEAVSVPKPFSFSDEVVTSASVGVCVFCSDPSSTFVFADTREPICERCVKG